jgi:hypothetical protein
MKQHLSGTRISANRQSPYRAASLALRRWPTAYSNSNSRSSATSYEVAVDLDVIFPSGVLPRHAHGEIGVRAQPIDLRIFEERGVSRDAPAGNH